MQTSKRSRAEVHPIYIQETTHETNWSNSWWNLLHVAISFWEIVEEVWERNEFRNGRNLSWKPQYLSIPNLCDYRDDILKSSDCRRGGHDSWRVKHVHDNFCFVFFCWCLIRLLMICMFADVLYFCWCFVLQLMLCTSYDVYFWCCVLLLMFFYFWHLVLLLMVFTSADVLFFCWCFILLLMFYTSADVLYFCWCFILLLMFYTSADVMSFCWCFVLLLMSTNPCHLFLCS